MSIIVYISGKYTGNTSEEIERNIAHARNTAVRVWKAGFFAHTPHMNTAFFEKEPRLAHIKKEDYVERDLWILGRCDVILMLDNWAESEGAKQEKAYAERMGIPVLYSVQDLETFPQMDPDCESHLRYLKATIIQKMDKKYRKGQAEHGGKLWLKDNLTMAIDEAVDHSVYCLTMEQQAKKGEFPPTNPIPDR